MTIQAEGPDGTVFEFPDGTPQGVVSNTIRTHYQRAGQAAGSRALARQTSRAVTPMALGYLAQPLVDMITDPARRQALTEDVGSALQSMQNYWSHPPSLQRWWGQTVAGIGRGLPQIPANVANAVTHPLTTARALTYGPFEDEELHQQQIDMARATGDTAELPQLARRANADTGNAAINFGGALTMGAGSAANVARGGVRGMLGQMTRGAGAGAGYGGVTGYALTQGGPEERAAGGASGAGTGAVLGATLPPVVNTALGSGRLAARGFGSIWNRLPTADPNVALGAFPGGLQWRQPRQAAAQLDPAAAGAIDRLARRSRMNPDQVEEALQSARTNPQGQVTADIFGDPGVRTMRSLVQSPGETGQRSLEVARTRFREMPGRIINGLRGALNVGETRQQAMARLNGDYARVSAENYRPIFEEPLTPEQSMQMAVDLKRQVGDFSMQQPVMRRAWQRAQQLFNLDLANGDVSGSFGANLPRMMHYLKMGLDDTVRVSMRRQGGLGANELRGVTRLSARLRNALDEVIPGYRQAREQWGTAAAAETALDRGVEFANMRPEDVQAEWASMSPFEREHARIGFVDEIQHSTRGGTNRNVNVARVLDDPDVQGVIRVMFNDPVEAAAYLDGTVNTQYQLGDNATQWRGNSQTASNILHSEDNAAAAEALGHTMTGNLGAAAVKLGRHAINVVSAGALEHNNNRVGEALLRRIDTADAQQFAQEVVAELRRRDRVRRTNAAGAAALAVQSGVNANKNAASGG